MDDEYLVNDEDLKSLANLIREKNGSEDDLEFPSDYLNILASFSKVVKTNSLTVTENGVYEAEEGYAFDNVIALVGDKEEYYIFEEDFLTGKLSGLYINSEIYAVRDYAFAGFYRLESIDFPYCSYVGQGAFLANGGLTNVSLPLCSYVGSNAFVGCTNLKEIELPLCESIFEWTFAYCSSLSYASFQNCKQIRASAFYECESLSVANFPSCETIYHRAFYSCGELKTANFPVCLNVPTYAFTFCRRLTSAIFPECRVLGSYAFYGCDSLPTISFQKCQIVGSEAFAWCYNLSEVSLGDCIRINEYAFATCRALSKIYINCSSVVELCNVEAFINTPIDGYVDGSFVGYGSIYVPSLLVSEYKSATNWVYYSSRIIGF